MNSNIVFYCLSLNSFTTYYAIIVMVIADIANLNFSEGGILVQGIFQFFSWEMYNENRKFGKSQVGVFNLIQALIMLKYPTIPLLALPGYNAPNSSMIKWLERESIMSREYCDIRIVNIIVNGKSTVNRFITSLTLTVLHI